MFFSKQKKNLNLHQRIFLCRNVTHCLYPILCIGLNKTQTGRKKKKNVEKPQLTF